jgi:hypothetical protein
MSVDRFKFISPGIFVNEIDNTGRSALPADVGPALIGRAEKGPILQPIKVKDFAEFVNEFGMPIPGGNGSDVSRNGNYISPTYAAYAAQAWLRNNSPVTYVRLGGQANDAATSDNGFAGWRTDNLTPSLTPASNGGAYGLFVAMSASDGGHGAYTETPVTGTLAAIWYLNDDCLIGLSGSSSCPAPAGNVPKSATSYQKLGSGQTFKVKIQSAAGGVSNATIIDSEFDFTETSDKYIRKVFNTNPTLCNSAITSDVQGYWLGETFEGAVKAVLTGSNTLGVILPLISGSDGSRSGHLADRRKNYQTGKTGWYIAQDMSQGLSTGSFDAGTMQKLFRVVARNAGSWSSKNLKISIQDLKRSPNTYQKYGSFTLAVRKMKDTDNTVEYVEQFNNVNLNPNSENYIARRIGDTYKTWDDTNRRYKDYGQYGNMSKYIRIEMNTSVDRGDTDPELLPWGVFGPLVYRSFTDLGSMTPGGTSGEAHLHTMVSGCFDDVHTGEIPDGTFISGSALGNVRYQFPRLRLRVSASEGSPVDPRDVYFGVDTTFNTSRYDPSVADHLTILARTTSDTNEGAGTDHSFVFTLDDMMNTNSALSGTNVYVSGSRAATPVATDASSIRRSLTYTRGTGSYTTILDSTGVDSFTALLFGGFDGTDITEAAPFNSTILDAATSAATSYPFNSVQVAIDSLRDPEVVEYNVAAMPGVKNNTLNRQLVEMCESRGDSLAVIDLKGGYTPKYENTTAETSRLGDVDTVVLNARNELLINSSYGAAYYPWVQIRDTSSGQLVWVPPSVAAIGAMSYSQKTADLWFAPAGFTRGGLSTGNAGLPVTAVRERLTSKQRDKLYEANINPIAQFPAEGIVIFGQKTLQATPSALDRINVRRLLIYLKRQISRFAATVIFDQNVRSTWNRFKGRVEPFLGSVQAGLGITKFKLVLDETTTTDDLIDRNIMYAKIYIKPARAIEYIALDFILTDNGAAFED